MGDTLDAFTDTYTWIAIVGSIMAGFFWVALLVWMIIGWYYGWDFERKLAKEKAKAQSTAAASTYPMEQKSPPLAPSPPQRTFPPNFNAPNSPPNYIPSAPPLSQTGMRIGDPTLNTILSNPPPVNSGRWDRTKSTLKNLYEKVGSKAQVVRDINYRGFLIYCCFGVATFTALLYVMYLATNPYAFSLRVGDSFPIGFTTCTQGLLDAGICGMVTTAMIRIVVFITNALGTATYLKWSKRATVLYVIFIGGFRTFIALFVAYGQDSTYWTLFGLASLFGGILASSLHWGSFFDDMEWCRGEDAPTVPFGVYANTSKTRGWVPALNNAYPETPIMGHWVNTINYGPKTWEFALNILIWLFEIIGYWFIYLFGVAGLNDMSSSDEVATFFGLDIICLLLFNGIKLWLNTAKSDYEIRAISNKLENDFNLPQQRIMVDNRF